jgi:ABC-type nitrate/sulfonate/bicarbonate transport system ATPase subunit
MSREYTTNGRLLSIENLSICYGPKTVLRDVNLHIDNIVRPGMLQGQTIGLLGPSGIGKTQLFRAIAGLQMPTTGGVLLHEAKTPVVAGQVGVVQQSYPLLSHRTIQGNLDLAGRKLGSKASAEIDRLLSHFGLLDKKKSYPLELSGGQRQRVAIVQQLLCNNHFVLMDEPFSGLDVVAKEKVYETIRAVTTEHEHNTVIFTSHDLESAVRLADEIWVLGREQGKEGGTAIKRINLIERGLAWDKDINRNPAFWPMVTELYELFKVL